MISCSTKILAKIGYVPLISVAEGLHLHKGKIYDIFFSYVKTEDLVAISYISEYKDKVIEKTIQLTPNLELQTPSGFQVINKLNFGDKIIVYDNKLDKENVRTISCKRPIKRDKLYCALPISTHTNYIINGIILRNVGLS